MNVPANLKYTKEHEWIRVEGNFAIVGITDYAQSELGEIVFVEVETIGETLKEGEVFGTVEAVKTVSDLYLPIDGTVIEFNEEYHDVSEAAGFISRYDEKELVKLIQTLSPAYRMVFNLYVFEGFKHREIAEILKVSEGTSKSNLADARKILQAALTVKKKIVSL